MKQTKLITFSFALLFIQACSHPIEIVGMGDVVTTDGTGTRECTYIDATATPVSDKCAKNIVSGNKMHEGGWWVPADYKETYTAVPHAGWMFDSWENCAFGILSTEDGNKCTFDVPAATVRAAWGATMPTLKAKFTAKVDTDEDGLFDDEDPCPANPNPACTDVINGNDIVTADGKEWAQADLFLNLSWEDIDAACPAANGGVCKSDATLNGYDVGGWTWPSVDDINSLFNFYIGSEELGPGPDAFYGASMETTWAPLVFAQPGGWRYTSYNGGHLELVIITLSPAVLIEDLVLTAMLVDAHHESLTDVDRAWTWQVILNAERAVWRATTFYR